VKLDKELAGDWWNINVVEADHRIGEFLILQGVRVM